MAGRKKKTSKRPSAKAHADLSGAKQLVVVESPTKARTMRRFLGPGYVVESCMGHVRDLPQSVKDIPAKYKVHKWARLGVDVENKFRPIYCVPRTKAKVVSALKKKLATASELILATDEDREGESISWHLLELLKPKVPVKRMVFHEITSQAIKNALHNTRSIDRDLVSAQEARRILDRLVGFTLSPFLWKKVAYGLSAGRVQSVALRLVCEREHERLRFVKTPYASLAAELVTAKSGAPLTAHMTQFKGQKIAKGSELATDGSGLLKDKRGQFLHLKIDQAESIAKNLEPEWRVHDLTSRTQSRSPKPPFITSSLQQEANRKLGLSAKECMRVAQKLYEQGYITYMRTDSVQMSQEAVSAARAFVQKRFGKEYVPAAARNYKAKKAKAAQEAHEAIRPAGQSFASPQELGLQAMEFKLYDLIWKRALASQMPDAKLELSSVQFHVAKNDAVFVLRGQRVVFDGFFRLYGDDFLSDKEALLPQLTKGDTLKMRSFEAKEHVSQPPARLTEASLVQSLEQAGVGRPSTYASIISTIQDRGYVHKNANQLVPSFTALVVHRLLAQHFSDYVDLDFTSGMEESLDQIARGELDWVQYLTQIYKGKKGLLAQVESKEKSVEPDKSRSISLSGFEGLDFRVGRYGAYVCRKAAAGEGVECASLQFNQAPADMQPQDAHKLIDQKLAGVDALGECPHTKERVYALNGPYGPYVQLGDAAEGHKPKRVSLPAGWALENVSLDKALALLELPKDLGQCPQTKQAVKVGIGRFGPYVERAGEYRSVPKDVEVLDVDLKLALELMSQPKATRGRVGRKLIKDLGLSNKQKVCIYDGRFGLYINRGRKNVSLPKGKDPESVTLKEALELLKTKS